MAVVGGETKSFQDYPFVVVIKTAQNEVCTGTLISPKLVLTAAHCIDKSLRLIQATKILPTVHAMKGQTLQKIKVERAIAHPGFESDEKVDLAMLKLEDEVQLEVYPTILDHSHATGDQLIMFGVGRHDPKLPSDLALRTLNIEVDTIEKRVISSFKPQMGACSGDSGGGLIKITKEGPRLAGVTYLVFQDMSEEQTKYFREVSYDREKLKERYPDIDTPCLNSRNYFMNLAPYYEWIKGHDDV